MEAVVVIFEGWQSPAQHADPQSEQHCHWRDGDHQQQCHELQFLTHCCGPVAQQDPLQQR